MYDDTTVFSAAVRKLYVYRPENFLVEDSSILHSLPLRSLGKRAPETAAAKKESAWTR